MNDLTQNYAEALVECGYALDYRKDKYWKIKLKPEPEYPDRMDWWTVQPLEDTLEGRRQADALEDWLDNKHPNLWVYSVDAVKVPHGNSQHQWRLDRIKWCFEQM